jgi:hypothetical protein
VKGEGVLDPLHLGFTTRSYRCCEAPICNRHEGGIMRKKLTKLGAAIAALAALAVGGSALATAAGGGSQPAKAPAAQQSAPTSEANDPVGAADTDSIQGENGKDDATEAENEANDPAENGSEVPGDDGPGGHADESGNPNADTEQEGEN